MHVLRMWCVQVMQNVIATASISANISVFVATAMIACTFLVTYCTAGIFPNFQYRTLRWSSSGVFLTIRCSALRLLRHLFYCTRKWRCLKKCIVVANSCFIWVHLSTRAQGLAGELSSAISHQRMSVRPSVWLYLFLSSHFYWTKVFLIKSYDQTVWRSQACLVTNQSVEFY